MIVLRKGLAVLLAALLLAACASNQLQKNRQEMMDRWEVLVRWSQFDALIDFIHPDWLEENPIARLDVDRLDQFRVTEYRVRTVLVDPDGKAAQRQVRIRMIHKHSAHERVIDHVEVWRYDEELKRWLLHSGLPDPRRD